MEEIKNRHENQYMHLGLNIAFYRKRNGFTQEALAEAVNISRNHISKIKAMNVKTYLSLEKLFDIADALQISASKLLELRE